MAERSVGRPKIAVVTPLFPTAAEPYRAAAIWNTLHALKAHADLSAYCIQPSYPAWLRPRSFRHQAVEADGSRYGIPTRTLRYGAVPGLTRMWNGAAICRRLRREIGAAKPDLILSYWMYPDAYAAVRLGRALGIPVLAGSRGSDLRVIEPNPVIRRKIRFTVREAAGVLCVSGDLARIARELGAAPARVHTILNGVDSAVFRLGDQARARRELGLPDGSRVVLFVGWLAELKGVAQLVEAIALLRERTGEDWRAVLVGEGRLADTLRRQAAALGLADQIALPGPLPAAAIARWMNACDLFCLPSASEGCPNVVIEALSCGRPVVATDVGGIPELVKPGCGILMRDNRPATIADALQQARQTVWDREQIARAHACSWEQVAEQTFRICRQALAGACQRVASERREDVYAKSS